jgi:predicted NUDIX family NTP pyrophosphohydrolase
MPRSSAGLLLYRRRPALEVLLVHPGGPFWAKRDEGAWSIPKGEFSEDEDALSAARREFEEELGQAPPDGPFIELGTIKQADGKLVTAWAVLGDFDLTTMRSNTFEIEWPPRSGLMKSFPEVDRAQWFDLDTARKKILPAQRPLLDQIEASVHRA